MDDAVSGPLPWLIASAWALSAISFLLFILWLNAQLEVVR